MKKLLLALTLVLTSLTIAQPAQASTTESCVHTDLIIRIPLTSAKHSAVIAHAKWAIRYDHQPRIMVLNRSGAAARRSALLKHIATRPGYDRDEYPAAVGRRVTYAHVRLVPSSQNRSAGAVMGNTLRNLCDGTKFVYAGV